MSAKVIKAYFSVSAIAVGVSASSLAELKQKVAAISGLEESAIYLQESGSYVLEDEDYFSDIPNNTCIYVQKKTSSHYENEAKLRLLKEKQNEVNSSSAPSGNIVSEKEAINDTTLSDFERNAMEFMRKVVVKDPSLLPAESVPLFWRYCESIDDKNMVNYAKNIFIKSPIDIFSSEGIKEISTAQWEEIVQWEHIQCTEYEIIASLFKWANINGKVKDQRVKEFIIPHLRLGQFSFSQLLKEIHPFKIVLGEDSVYPFVRYHLLSKEKSAAFAQQHNKLFEFREFQKENYKAGQLASRDTPMTVSAKGRPWTLLMSSQYAGLPNNYDSLVSGNWNHPGIATNYGAPPAEFGTDYQFIQATFDTQVAVSKLIVSSPTKGLFASQGWGNGYITQLTFRYSKDDDGPFEVVKSLAGTVDKDGPIEIDISEMGIVGKRFRLCSGGYVCTGSFILE